MTTNVQTSSILTEIQAERLHQGTTNGYVRGVFRHDEGELAMAAAAFAVQSTGTGSGADILWPWSGLMPAYATRRHRLIVAGALIVAEIERIDGAMNIEGQSPASFADIAEHFQESGGLVELGFADPPQAELTADFTRALPGGGMDDSTFDAVETALDRADAPSTEAGRWLTLVERVNALYRKLAHAHQAIRQARTQISGGLCYLTVDAKHAQLQDAAKTLDAVGELIDAEGIRA